MKKTYKLTAMLLALLFVAAAFAGCAAPAAPAASSEAAPAAAADAAAPAEAAAPAAEGGVTINFLCVNENYPASMQNCIARWEEKTGNKVDVQLYPATEFGTILTTQMMSGGTVDMFRSDGAKYAEIAWPLDYFYDLSNEEWVSRLIPEIKTLVSFSDGTVRGLPYMNNSTFGMMYNKAIFEKAGITTLPANWTEFLDACEKIKAQGVTPVNISLANGSEFCTTHLMHQLFNNVYLTRGADGAKQLFKDFDANTAKFADTPEYLASLQQMVELRDKGYISEDFISNTYEMAVERFGSGQVAMHPCGDFILESLLASYPEIEEQIGFFPCPYQDTKGSMSYCAGVGLHVANNAPHLDATLDFMAYYASYENQLLYSQDSPGLNLFSDVPASNNVITKACEDYMDVTFSEIDDCGCMVWPEMEARSIMQELMLGEKTPEEMLKAMDDAASVTAKGLGLAGW